MSACSACWRWRANRLIRDCRGRMERGGRILESNEKRVRRILGKLTLVRHRGLSCFGSKSHKFRLNVPLEEATLERFEAEHGITLPADFRCFLKLAGNGGAGPYYGIFKLDQWSDFIDWTTDDRPENILALPCPLHPGMSRNTEWEAQFGDCASPYQGMIAIGSQGCSYEMGLIVTGEYAGRVVYLDAGGLAPYVVREPDFLAWYERWLDELLGGYDMFWFGFGLGGDEASLTALLDDPAASVSDRADAVYAIRRLPTLSPAGRMKISRLLRNDVPEVRAAACGVVEKFEIAEVADVLQDLLHDESPEVQKAAISANIKLNGDAVANDVAHLLESSDAEVAQRAFFRLKEIGKLSREMLLRLVELSPHAGIRSLSVHAVEWKSEEEQLLIRLLKDVDSQVRFYATLGLRQIASRACLNAVCDLLNHEAAQNVIGSILKMLGEVPSDRNAEVLLQWTASDDDFHRLAALDSLCKLGDIRVEPVAKNLLTETRSPRRVDAAGFSTTTHVKSIRRLVQESLRASPNRQLRRLGSRIRWPQWLTIKKPRE